MAMFANGQEPRLRHDQTHPGQGRALASGSARSHKTRRSVAITFAAGLMASHVACTAKKRSDGEGQAPFKDITHDNSLSIVGGQDVADGDALIASTVAINSGPTQLRCTGTLIAPSVVLSAAHCFVGTGLDNSNLSIVFGNTNTAADKRKVVKVIPHASYNPKTPLGESAPLSDVALVQFEGTAPSWARTARVPGPNDPLQVGQNFLMAGFGWNRTSTLIIWRSGGGQGKLRKLTLPLTTVLETSRQLKFQASGKAVCSGDSGGPGYVAEGTGLTVFGVTSWGYSRCENGLSVFSDVRKYRDWIDANMPTGTVPPGSGGTATTPGPSPQPTAAPIPIANVAEADRRYVEEAIRIYNQHRAGQLPKIGEVRAKTQGKYDRNLLLFIPNTQPAYRCVHIRADGSHFQRRFGERSEKWVYYNHIRVSQESNFDALGCDWQHTAGQWLWYLD